MLSLLSLSLLGASPGLHVLTDHGNGGMALARSRCISQMTVSRIASSVGVGGALALDATNHVRELSLDPRSKPYIVGTLETTISIACPSRDDELLEPFDFVLTAKTLAVEPTDGILIFVSQSAKIVVTELMMALSSPAPINVQDARFNAPHGLHMKILHGKANVLGRVFDLEGYEADADLKGTFRVNEATKQVELVVQPSKGEFTIKSAHPHIQGTLILAPGFLATAEAALPGLLEVSSAEAVEVAVTDADATDATIVAEEDKVGDGEDDAEEEVFADATDSAVDGGDGPDTAADGNAAADAADASEHGRMLSTAPSAGSKSSGLSMVAGSILLVAGLAVAATVAVVRSGPASLPLHGSVQKLLSAVAPDSKSAVQTAAEAVV
jgi:hypothetical protein